MNYIFSIIAIIDIYSHKDNFNTCCIQDYPWGNFNDTHYSGLTNYKHSHWMRGAVTHCFASHHVFKNEHIFFYECTLCTLAMSLTVCFGLRFSTDCSVRMSQLSTVLLGQCVTTMRQSMTAKESVVKVMFLLLLSRLQDS